MNRGYKDTRIQGYKDARIKGYTWINKNIRIKNNI